MTERTRMVLVVDDTPSNLAVLLGMLGEEGYEVLAAENAVEALEILEEDAPDIILLDVMMPGMDGYTLCRHLKQQQQRLADIPVIFITAKSGTQDVVEGFAAGAVDYVAKPFQRPEVLARVRTHIRLHEALVELERLHKLALDASPLTGLPGNNTIAKTVEEAIAAGADVAVIYCDLDNFKAFNDVYGFSAGDEVILFSARIMREALERQQQAHDSTEGFLGHIGGDDFVVMLPSSWADVYGAEVGHCYDAEVVSFYNETDRARGHIVTKDRQGVVREFPFVSVTMAGLYLAKRPLNHFLEVASVCAEVKKWGKAVQGSVLLFDRRVGPWEESDDPDSKEHP